ncbi:hypothetical protein G7072_11845 [Nocardioides sp. HDW12B]|uniref:hypothetical protein n=1 Tax=Nocardioides sp. HDW12B TaxID=2714939 RepID=UPI00140C3804|nr:hypothetical protein [Nocardioides sp. HDW12B]QIK66943.1 hypothetical protein G7072_11845 [Nocardioides sp. HDW12B]
MDRRTVVVGLASLGGSAALLLTGCGPRARASGSAATGAKAGGDTALVATALNAELAAVDVLERTRRRHPRLRGATESALATHRAHVRLLQGTTDKAPTRPSERRPVPGRPPQALAALVQLEAQVSSGHVSTALAARSGALARVVASMAAASAQLEQTLASGAGR